MIGLVGDVRKNRAWRAHLVVAPGAETGTTFYKSLAARKLRLDRSTLQRSLVRPAPTP